MHPLLTSYTFRDRRLWAKPENTQDEDLPLYTPPIYTLYPNDAFNFARRSQPQEQEIVHTIDIEIGPKTAQEIPAPAMNLQLCSVTLTHYRNETDHSIILFIDDSLSNTVIQPSSEVNLFPTNQIWEQDVNTDYIYCDRKKMESCSHPLGIDSTVVVPDWPVFLQMKDESCVIDGHLHLTYSEYSKCLDLYGLKRNKIGGCAFDGGLTEGNLTVTILAKYIVVNTGETSIEECQV